MSSPHNRIISSFFFFLLITLAIPSPSLSQQNGNVSCPLDFSILRPLVADSNRRLPDRNTTCQYIRQGLRLVQSQYLRLNGSFVPPLNSSDSCWTAYQSLLSPLFPNFNIRTACGFQTSWISEGCMNVTTRSQYEARIPPSVLRDVVSNCNQSLDDGSPCASCTKSLASMQGYGNSVGNLSDCFAFPTIYAAAVNLFGPMDQGTAQCLFSIDFRNNSSGSKKKKRRKKKKVVILVVVIVTVVGFAGVVGGSWGIYRKRKKMKKRVMRDKVRNLEMGSGDGLRSIGESTNLVKFSLDEIKKATRNLSRDSIIGRGGYGNVYKGVLPDGSEVAV